MPERTDTTAGAARESVADAAKKGELDVAAQPGTLAAMLQKQAPEIARALPGGDVDAMRFVRIVQTELRKNPELMRCSAESFMGSVLTAAQLGLEFGPMQQAHLVPFGGEATLIIGYRGWNALISRSAEILDVSARTVYERDKFMVEYGMDERLVHAPAVGLTGQVLPPEERGKVVGYYCVIRKTNGGRTFAYMTAEEVRHHRDRYAKKRRDGSFAGPWADPDQYEAMAWKTVFLKAKTWVPTSAERLMALAEATDNRVVRKLTADAEPEVSEPDDEEIVEGEIVGGAAPAGDAADEEWRRDATP